MISDDKVGPGGVKVRCKKCGHVILVRRSEPELAPEAAAAGGLAVDGWIAIADQPPEECLHSRRRAKECRGD
jgi:hypothetical protein